MAEQGSGTMQEQEEIVEMKCRVFRIAQKKWNLTGAYLILWIRHTIKNGGR